jgi:hypothetical protein
MKNASDINVSLLFEVSFFFATESPHRLIPVIITSSKVQLRGAVAKKASRSAPPGSPPSADDSCAPLQVFPHRARAEVQHIRCFARREQAISNGRGVTLQLLSCFDFVVSSSRSPVAFVHGLAAQEKKTALILCLPKLPSLRGAKRLSGSSAVPY